MFGKNKLFWILFAILCSNVSAQNSRSDIFHSRYTLSEVVVLSRHNIRSPLAGKGSVIDRITPHKWFAWTSSSSRLSLKGGVMETMMGQYFHKWLMEEGLFLEDEMPASNEVRVYANSMQRTMATARYFMSGFMPVANIPVEHHCEVGVMDSIFTPQITRISDEFCKTAFHQIAEINGEQVNMHKESQSSYYCVLNNAQNRLAPNYASLCSVLDIRESPACIKGDTCRIAGFDTIWLRLNQEPQTTGALKLAYSAADAMILQYYEESDDLKASFGHKLNYNDWLQISEIKDWYGDLLFTAPIVAKQVAAPLLNEIVRELNTPYRKFSFLCGHDSNIGSVLAALGVSNYSLPNTIERKTPIGTKLVFEKWVDNNGKYYVSVSLIYHSSAQMRQSSYSDFTPIKYPIQIDGLSTNSDGLYSLKDFLDKM